MAASGNPFSNIGQDIIDLIDPGLSFSSSVSSGFSGFFSSIGGGIASGLEAGFDQFVLDIWNEIIGPLEILLGSIIILIALSFMMSDNLLAVAPYIAAAM